MSLLSRWKILWIALTIFLIVSLDLIISRFLLDKLPVLAVILIVLVSVVSLTAAPSPRTKRAYKTIFLVILVTSAGFMISVYAGIFESMVLLDDSWLDVSHSAFIFHLKNNGLTDWRIKEVETDNIAFTFSYPSTNLRENLDAGDTSYLVIYYSESIFQWIISAYGVSINWDSAQPFHPSYPMDWSCSTRGEISPATFQNGSTYKVSFVTDGVLRHSFNVKAKSTLDEELKVTARKWFREIPSPAKEIWVQLNNTGDYYSYVYTIQVANVTFLFKPPIKVSPSSWEEMRLFFSDGEDSFGWSVNYYGNIYATPTPAFSMLKIGTSYDVLVRTMTNNLYTTNITI